MLAFSKDITQKEPHHSQEGKDAKLKDYMHYQRQLNNVQIVYHALRYAKIHLEENMEACRKSQQDPSSYLDHAFHFSHEFADSKTLLLMVKKLIAGHNMPKKWYRMNAYYHALVYDCLKEFIAYYNELVEASSEKAKDYTISHGLAIDFKDWVYLFFPDLDFHLGQDLGYKQYPFAKRNLAIEAELAKDTEKGLSLKEALEHVKADFEIDDCSIKVLTHVAISHEDQELFYTTMDNPIYEFLSHKKEGSWDTMDGESLMDQAYTMGSQLKVTVWKKRKKKVSQD